MLVIVAHAILVEGGRPGGLIPPNDASLGEDRERFEDGLLGGGAKLMANILQYFVRGEVGARRNGAQNRQSLGRYLEAEATQGSRGIVQTKTRVKYPESLNFRSDSILLENGNNSVSHCLITG